MIAQRMHKILKVIEFIRFKAATVILRKRKKETFFSLLFYILYSALVFEDRVNFWALHRTLNEHLTVELRLMCILIKNAIKVAKL